MTRALGRVPPEDAPLQPAKGPGRLPRRLALRLTRGEHLLLWGPRGMGKTSLLGAVMTELGPRRCAISASTACLDDVTRALERACADTATAGLSRRAARARLWRAADADPPVLLLDHVTRVPAAMKGWLRRLRGGVAGILLAVDVDSPRERERLRRLRVGCETIRMPPVASRSLARRLDQLWASVGAPPLPRATRRALVRAARGRPGWIHLCATLAADGGYWHAGQLRVQRMTWDVETRLRGIPGGDAPSPARAGLAVEPGARRARPALGNR